LLLLDVVKALIFQSIIQGLLLLQMTCLSSFVHCLTGKVFFIFGWRDLLLLLLGVLLLRAFSKVPSDAAENAFFFLFFLSVVVDYLSIVFESRRSNSFAAVFDKTIVGSFVLLFLLEFLLSGKQIQ
jgi:hypothetical protein